MTLNICTDIGYHSTTLFNNDDLVEGHDGEYPSSTSADESETKSSESDNEDALHFPWSPSPASLNTDFLMMDHAPSPPSIGTDHGSPPILDVFPHDMNTDQLQIVNHLDDLESSWLLVSPPPLTADDGEIMSEGNIPSIANTPTQPRSSHRQREQVPHAESNTLSCADCDTMFKNDTELVTCDGPGCDQVVCACNFNLCISTTHASAINFTLHVEVYARNPLEVGSVIVYAGKVQDFGL